MRSKFASDFRLIAGSQLVRLNLSTGSVQCFHPANGNDTMTRRFCTLSTASHSSIVTDCGRYVFAAVFLFVMYFASANKITWKGKSAYKFGVLSSEDISRGVTLVWKVWGTKLEAPVAPRIDRDTKVKNGGEWEEDILPSRLKGLRQW